eukprot:gnl/Chilomastix_cuspidata/1524.p1 GENE.gnl/Chilomastix_cuspidata/1524~~gnl/Chilomastix_cuspidata/1524.p1  ORF type:complete len:706 (-),score=304.83 gnl/Chilomastix_cuspidata/1524:12-1916(-)
MSYRFMLGWTRILVLKTARATPDFMEAHDQVLPEVTKFLTDIYLDPGMWRLVSATAARLHDAALSPEERRLVNETVKDFEEQGAGLPEDKKARLSKVVQELSLATSKYTQNTNRVRSTYELLITDAAQLPGLPERALQQAHESALQKGYGTEAEPQYRFTLDDMSYRPVLQFCENEALRERLWRARTGVARSGENDNRPLIKQILELRHERAQLLGKDTFADYATSRAMVKSGSAVFAFLSDFKRKLNAPFERECRELLDFRREHSPAGTPDALHPWDMLFWSERFRKASLGWDSEVMRAYLPLDHVLERMFDIARSLFDIALTEGATWFGEEGDGVEVWAPGVRFFRIERGGAHLGSFYLDLFPRDFKESGAWMYNFGQPAPRAGKTHPRLGGIFGNFAPGSGGRPPLLSHGEATTLFHEFGHLLHFMFCSSRFPSTDFDGCPADFIELPSQLLENWCWDPECLRALTRHYETGAPLPDDQIALLAQVREFRAASFYMRQLSFSAIDYRLHYELSGKVPADVLAEADDAASGFAIATTEPSTINICDFSHLFSSSTGYAANYYSYLWSETLEADCFLRFKTGGVLNREIGRELHDKLLSQGSMKDHMELFKDFMGREPSPDALLQRVGLLESK